EAPLEVRLEGPYFVRELLEEVDCRRVHDRVDRVEAKAVDVVLLEPVERVFDQKTAHLEAARPVEVQRITPGSAISIREVRPVHGEVVPVRPEVVVNDVEQHGEPARVARIDEALEARRTAVGVVRRIQIDAVVAPAARPWKLRD